MYRLSFPSSIEDVTVRFLVALFELYQNSVLLLTKVFRGHRVRSILRRAKRTAPRGILRNVPLSLQRATGPTLSQVFSQMNVNSN